MTRTGTSHDVVMTSNGTSCDVIMTSTGTSCDVWFPNGSDHTCYLGLHEEGEVEHINSTRVRETLYPPIVSSDPELPGSCIERKWRPERPP